MFESCSKFRCNRHGELPEAHGKPPWRALHLCPVVINWNFVQVNGNGMANVDKMQLQVRHILLNLRLHFPRQKLQQQRLCNLQLQLAAIVWLAVRLSVSLSVPIPIASFRLFSCPFYRNRGTGKIFWQMNLNNRLQSLREGERGAERPQDRRHMRGPGPCIQHPLPVPGQENVWPDNLDTSFILKRCCPTWPCWVSAVRCTNEIDTSD